MELSYAHSLSGFLEKAPLYYHKGMAKAIGASADRKKWDNAVKRDFLVPGLC
jgi:hypothetical protein